MQTNPLKLLLKHLILQEATRFKRETGKVLPRWQDKLVKYEKEGGFFVSFSSIPRMGLFLRNKYKTPIGFYTYPLNRTELSNFAVDRPYALIVKPKPEAKLLVLQTYSESDLQQDIQKLVGWKYSKDRIKTAMTKANVQTPGGKLWNVTRVLSGADKLGGEDEEELPERGGGATGKWTMLLKRLGYDGVVDGGFGIIHKSEPFQAVFFDTTKLELVEVIEKEVTPTKGKLFDRGAEKGDLRGKDLSGQNLFRANLTGANLTGANLVRAILREANLERAKLIEANLERANLERAKLIEANLEGAILSGANLVRANLERANLTGANLTGANLYEASLRGANLERANLDGASLYEASLRGANLERANLDGASLQGTNLNGANLTGANLYEASLRGANLNGANLTGANLTGANLQGTNLNGAKYDSETKFPKGFDPKSAGMAENLRDGLGYVLE